MFPGRNKGNLADKAIESHGVAILDCLLKFFEVAMCPARLKETHLPGGRLLTASKNFRGNWHAFC
jgi:hypothetical protein